MFQSRRGRAEDPDVDKKAVVGEMAVTVEKKVVAGEMTAVVGEMAVTVETVTVEATTTLKPQMTWRIVS